MQQTRGVNTSRDRQGLKLQGLLLQGTRKVTLQGMSKSSLSLSALTPALVCSLQR